MTKEKYIKPQVYRVKLEPEQAVLACCVIGAVRRKYTNLDCGEATNCLGLDASTSATSS